MASVERRGQRWCIRWRNPGERSGRRLTVPDPQTARELAAEATRAEARGERWVPPQERAPEVGLRPLEDLAVDWLAAKGRTKRESTISGYADSLQRFIDHAKGVHGRTPTLAMLRPALVESFDSENARAGKMVATRRTRVAAVKSWVNWLAATWPDAIRAEPFRLVEMPAMEKPVALALSWDEIDAIIDHMAGHGRVAAMIARCTGLRRSEATAIRWCDLHGGPGGDAAVGFLNLPSEVTKGGRSGRLVPVSPVLWDYLNEHRARLADFNPDERLAPVTGPSFGAMFATAIGAAVAEGVCNPMAVEVRSSTHLLRKAFCTNLRRAGADADAVEQLVGHDIGVRRAYLDLDQQMLRAVQLVPAFAPRRPSGGGAEKVVALRKH